MNNCGGKSAGKHKRKHQRINKHRYCEPAEIYAQNKSEGNYRSGCQCKENKNQSKIRLACGKESNNIEYMPCQEKYSPDEGNYRKHLFAEKAVCKA